MHSIGVDVGRGCAPAGAGDAALRRSTGSLPQTAGAPSEGKAKWWSQLRPEDSFSPRGLHAPHQLPDLGPADAAAIDGGRSVGLVSLASVKGSRADASGAGAAPDEPASPRRVALPAPGSPLSRVHAVSATPPLSPHSPRTPPRGVTSLVPPHFHGDAQPLLLASCSSPVKPGTIPDDLWDESDQVVGERARRPCSRPSRIWPGHAPRDMQRLGQDGIQIVAVATPSKGTMPHPLPLSLRSFLLRPVFLVERRQQPIHAHRVGIRAMPPPAHRGAVHGDRPRGRARHGRRGPTGVGAGSDHHDKRRPRHCRCSPGPAAPVLPRGLRQRVPEPQRARGRGDTGSRPSRGRPAPPAHRAGGRPGLQFEGGLPDSPARGVHDCAGDPGREARAQGAPISGRGCG